MKFNISMKDDLFERFDKFSKDRHVNRSALVSIAVQQYMDAIEQLPEVQCKLDELKDILNKIEQESKNK